MQGRLSVLVRGVDGGGVAPDGGLDGLDALASLFRKQQVVASDGEQSGQEGDNSHRTPPVLQS
jgi:hypothetical protein